MPAGSYHVHYYTDCKLTWETHFTRRKSWKPFDDVYSDCVVVLYLYKIYIQNRIVCYFWLQIYVSPKTRIQDISIHFFDVWRTDLATKNNKNKTTKTATARENFVSELIILLLRTKKLITNFNEYIRTGKSLCNGNKSFLITCKIMVKHIWSISHPKHIIQHSIYLSWKLSNYMKSLTPCSLHMIFSKHIKQRFALHPNIRFTMSCWSDITFNYNYFNTSTEK